MSTVEKYAKWQTFGTGAAVGLVGSTISMLSNEIIRTPLGFSPMSIKKVVKVGLVSGLSTMGVMWGYDEYKNWNYNISMI